MATFLLITAILLSLAGFIGCIIPGLPGPPLNYIALWLVQAACHPFSNTLLGLALLLTGVVLILDYYLPIWTAKKFGATRQGVIGSVIGMFAGLIFGFAGMLIGLVAGALIGDMIAGKSASAAMRSAAATVLGTLFSTGLKMMLALWMTWLVMSESVHYWGGF